MSERPYRYISEWTLNKMYRQAVRRSRKATTGGYHAIAANELDIAETYAAELDIREAKELDPFRSLKKRGDSW